MHKSAVLAVVVVSSLAYGEPLPRSSPRGGVAVTGERSVLWLGGGLALTSEGTLYVNTPSFMLWGDLTSAFAVNATADYPLNKLVTLRAMPRYIMNIGLTNDAGTPADSAVDLRVGATIGTHVVPQLRLYGVGALGYASMSGSNLSKSANGPTMSLGAGGACAINPTLRLYVEAVYEWGFYKLNDDDLKIKWLELSAGFQFGFAR